MLSARDEIILGSVGLLIRSEYRKSFKQPGRSLEAESALPCRVLQNECMHKFMSDELAGIEIHFFHFGCYVDHRAVLWRHTAQAFPANQGHKPMAIRPAPTHDYFHVVLKVQLNKLFNLIHPAIHRAKSPGLFGSLWKIDGGPSIRLFVIARFYDRPR